jgi:hypothetical protein
VSGCLPSLLISGSYVAPEHESLLAVVAEPLSSTTDFLESLSAHPHWNDEVRALVSSAVTNRQHSYSPSLAVPLRTVRRPNGVALTTTGEPIGSGQNRTAEVTFHESGSIVLISERPAATRSFANVNPRPPDVKVILDDLIVGNVELVVRLTAQVGRKYRYYGGWQIAVVVSGLDGATSTKMVDQWGEPRPNLTPASPRRPGANLGRIEPVPKTYRQRSKSLSPSQYACSR